MKKQLFLVSLLLCSSVWADTIPAASCSNTDVQAAIDTAVTGDTVTVPAGSCIWAASVSIPSGKSITLQGAASHATIITRAGSALSLDRAGARVTGFHFKLDATSTLIIVKGTDWRIDNNILENLSPDTSRVCIEASGLNVDVPPWPGVVDSNEFIGCRVLVNAFFTKAKMDTSWAEAHTLGTDQTVFVEDNTFELPGGTRNCMDANRAGRYVFRHNTTNGCYIEAHSLQSSTERATRSWEIYNNIITNNQTSIYRWAFLRGGTGVLTNNTVSGSFDTTDAVFDNVRSFSVVSGDAGGCDGASSWDGNTTGEAGWPCRDQIGRGKDDAGTFPQPQASGPVYVWSNTFGGSATGVVVQNCGNTVKTNGSCADIVAGRDYILDVHPTWTPYTYPHPLRGYAKPTNVRGGAAGGRAVPR